MEINRKHFIKNVCLTAACCCGFGTLALGNDKKSKAIEFSSDNNEANLMLKEWLATLLNNLNSNVNSQELKQIIKKGAKIHYNNLNMDKVLSEYIGDLKKFIGFIQEKWGWVIEYDESKKTLLANENKNYCVCPLINPENKNSSALCNCSEGFAEMMFSKVAGLPAKATVKSSILRGDKQCIYEIIF
jgi:hypothetical protein